MARLKGLDERPATTGLDLQWDEILPGGSGRSTLAARRRASSNRIRIVSAGLTAVVVAVGGYAFSQGLLPTGEQIRTEIERRAAAMSTARDGSAALEPAMAPGLQGVAAGVAPPPAARPGFYGERLGTPFPSGRVDRTAPDDPAIPYSPVAFADLTGNGMPKAIRIRDLSGDRVWLTAYLEPGGKVETELPAGGYRVFIAEGAAWRGDGEQFGDDGRYYAPQVLDVRDGRAILVRLPPAGAGGSQPLGARGEF